MPLARLQWAPGVNTQQTQTQNSHGWFASNLIRWRNGLLEKVAGWVRLFSTPCADIVRGLHAYLDLLSEQNLLIGTDNGAQLFVRTSAGVETLYNVIFTGNEIRDQDATNSFTTTSGSKIITVHDPGHGAVLGQYINLPMTLQIDNRLVPAGQYLVASVIGPNDFTFLMPLNATSSIALSLVAPQITLGVAGTRVLFNNMASHGLVVGNSFTFQAETNVQQDTPGLITYSVIIPAGTVVTVRSVPTANSFTFDSSSFVSVTTGTQTSAQVGEGAMQGVDDASAVQGVILQYSSSAPPSPQNWFLDNLGNYGLYQYDGSAIYVYTPPPTGTIVIAANAGLTTSPQINAGMFVAMPQAQIIAFGSEVVLGGGQQDPLLIRFSDAGSFSVWEASATNQAGSFRLGSSGSRIVGGVQAPQTTLIWTDADLWSMQYVGPPLVYSFATIGTGCGLVAPRAQATLGRTCIWVSIRGFFKYSDGGIAPMLCPVYDEIFGDLDVDNIYKVHCGANSSAHEIWTFFPSLSGGTGECDKYVKYNVVEDLWDYGYLARSAWLEESEFGTPLGADYNFRIQQHEQGYDDDGVAMAGVFAETGYADVGDGDRIMFVDEYIQDMKWFGENGAAYITLLGVNYPGETPTLKGPFGLDNENRYIRPQMRARQIALRIDWVERAGFSARLGTPRFRVAPAGRRP